MARIFAERMRQIHEENWTLDHDDGHKAGELSRAAASYAAAGSSAVRGHETGAIPPVSWPWHKMAWHPSNDPIKNLVKAGALIAAEIDRLERLLAVRG